MWQEYQGAAGYDRMVTELQQSVDEAYPELKGRIYIFNQLAPLDEEIKRAEAALGLRSGEFVRQIEAKVDHGDFPKSRVHGMAFGLTREDGTTLSVAMGAGFSRKLSAEDIRGYARNTVHEMGHGIFSLLHSEEDLLMNPHADALFQKTNMIGAEQLPDNEVQLFSSLNPEDRKRLLEFQEKFRFQETFAEVFMNALLVHNGAPKKRWDTASANYDARKVSGFAFDVYDPGEEMTYVESTHPEFLNADQELQGYRLKGIKQAFEIAYEAGKANASASPEKFYEEYAQEIITAFVHTLELGSMEEKERLSWLADRQSIIYNAAQSIAAAKWLAENEEASVEGGAAYKTAKPQVESLEQAAGRAYLKYRETGSDADKVLAAGLLRMTFLLDDFGFRPDFKLGDDQLITLMENTPDIEWAKQMAGGVPIERVADSLRALTAKDGKSGDLER